MRSAAQHAARDLAQVLAVLLRDQHGVDAGAVRGEQLLLEAADRQHAAAQRDLAGHRDVVAHRDARQRARDAGRHGDARARAVLADELGEVNVESIFW